MSAMPTTFADVEPYLRMADAIVVLKAIESLTHQIDAAERAGDDWSGRPVAVIREERAVAEQEIVRRCGEAR